MTAGGTEALLGRAAHYAAGFDAAGAPVAPATGVAVVTCMDARIETGALLGLGEGEAHVIRNAGGVVTDDVVRSLAISQSVLGTREIMLIQHTRCGLLGGDDEGLCDEIEAATSARPDFPMHTFADLETNLRASLARLKASPFLAHTGLIRGFVYDVDTGRLTEVA